MNGPRDSVETERLGEAVETFEDIGVTVESADIDAASSHGYVEAVLDCVWATGDDRDRPEGATPIGVSPIGEVGVGDTDIVATIVERLRLDHDITVEAFDVDGRNPGATFATFDLRWSP